MGGGSPPIAITRQLVAEFSGNILFFLLQFLASSWATETPRIVKKVFTVAINIWGEVVLEKNEVFPPGISTKKNAPVEIFKLEKNWDATMDSHNYTS